jgi:uncharacterized membrane-anchored protein
MMCSNHFKSRANRRNVLSAALIAGFCLCLLNQSGFGQQDILSPPASVNSPQWVIGPATASIGDTANITVPEGCRFTDQNGARAVLASSREPVPDNLAGLLFPDSRQWFAVIQFTENGYVKTADNETLDADAILKKYQSDLSRQFKEHSLAGGRAAIPDVSWELKPFYDPALNKLEYALKAKNAGGGSINYVVNWLGRRGMLSVTVVQSGKADFNLASLRDAVKGISFKNGERYTDHEPADRVARLGLADLILNSNGVEPLNRWERLAHNKWLWAGTAAVLLLGAYGLVILMVKKHKFHYYRMDEKYRRGARASAPQTVAANGHAVNGNGQPHVELANGQTALRSSSGFQRNGHRRRKKRFSYHAFYSDMVMNLTRCNYVGSPGGFLHGQNGQPVNVDPNPSQDMGHNSAMPDAASLLVTETSKLIQSQQKLIEGQRKLIEEQTKLIQEKSMLIDAETRVMGKQSEMLSEQQLLP